MFQKENLTSAGKNFYPNTELCINNFFNQNYQVNSKTTVILLTWTCHWSSIVCMSHLKVSV